VTQFCENCHSTCYTCLKNTSNDCLACKDGRYLQVIDIPTGTGPCLDIAVTPCYTGFYPNSASPANLKCSACDGTCLTCSGPSNSECLTCDPTKDLFLTSTKHCKLTCGNNFYPESSDNKCYPCHSSCLSCKNDAADSCKAC